MFGFMANSQTISKLDEKNGFREFKFGTPFSAWASQLSIIRTVNEIGQYNYIGNCCSTFMGVKIDGIALEFDNNKLTTITLIFDNSNATDVSYKLKEYSNIKGKIVEEFGEPIKSNSNTNEGKIDNYWLGAKVAMNLSSTYQGYKVGVQNVLIITAYKNKKSDGF
jgi:hypothetical protein